MTTGLSSMPLAWCAQLNMRLNPSFPSLFPAARLPARLQKLMMPSEEKLKAEIAELRIMVDEAEAVLNSVKAQLGDAQAEVVELGGTPITET